MSDDADRGSGPGEAYVSGHDHPAFDTTVAHQARIYNYWLGRKVEVVHTLNLTFT